MTNCENDSKACGHCNIWLVQMKRNKVLSAGGEERERKRSEVRTWSPRTTAYQRRPQSADSSLDDSILTHRLLPPASSLLCLCLTSQLSHAFHTPGRSAPPWHTIGPGKAPKGLFQQSWKSGMSRGTKAKPPSATAAISSLFISWPCCFALVVMVGITVKDI